MELEDFHDPSDRILTNARRRMDQFVRDSAISLALKYLGDTSVSPERASPSTDKHAITLDEIFDWLLQHTPPRHRRWGFFNGRMKTGWGRALHVHKITPLPLSLQSDVVDAITARARTDARMDARLVSALSLPGLCADRQLRVRG
jgi:hypothetical protein